MLITTLKDLKEHPFALYKNLEFEKEINELTNLTFEIPKEYRHIFQVECLITHDEEVYEVKNIEPFYEGYKIEARQAVYTLQYNFLKSVNFPHKDFETIIKGILPSSWSYKIVGQIEGRRTMTADHMDSWEAIKLAVKKFDCEFKIHAEESLIIFGKELGEDKGKCFFDDLNIKDKDITEESFDFATRIIPEGMNGLKINQINGGKDYLEDKSYCFKTITYYWKDERYTNIQNLKDEAARKLEALSRPRITIKLKVQDLSDAIDIKGVKYDVGDYVYLIDRDRKTKERYRIVAGSFYPYKPFDNDLTLANKPLDMVDDFEENIELTKEMWEETRVRFETTEDAIKSSVSTAKRYTDDSFKTYKTERLQTDKKIYEKISESTTYVDPKTGQTKPIVNKQMEIDKTIDGINITVADYKYTQDKNIQEIEQRKAEIAGALERIAETRKEMENQGNSFHEEIYQLDEDLKRQIGTVKYDMTNLDELVKSSNDDFITYKKEREAKDVTLEKELLEIKSNVDITNEKISTSVSSLTRSVEAQITETKTYAKNLQGEMKTYTDTELSNYKTYVSNNYASLYQTDKLISASVGEIKTTVNTFGEYLLHQGDTITTVQSQLNMAAGLITQKVSKNEIISEINQSPEQVKIKAEKIDLEGNMTLRGSFETIDKGEGVGIKMEHNRIGFADYRGSGSEYGNIRVTRGLDSGAMAMSVGHYQGAYLNLGFWDKDIKAWRSYIALDRWQHTDRRQGFPIQVFYGTEFKGLTYFNSDIYMNGILIKNYSDGVGFLRRGTDSGFVIANDGVYVKTNGSLRKL